MSKSQIFLGTGRRKTAIARVFLKKGSGKIEINGKGFESFCYSENLQKTVLAPLKIVEAEQAVDAKISVIGGGVIGQSGAISHGLARALEKMNPNWRLPLKKQGLLTRDPRSRERKKPGQPGARKRFQYSKR